jgi:hypothetical protein
VPTRLPSTLGRYELIREIARSNDVVYEAWDPHTHRRVALKALSLPDGASEAQVAERIQRFEREARAAARLHHSNIVTLFDFGTDGEQPFLVFEFIEGNTLSDVIEQRSPLDASEARGLALQMLSAVGYAHSQGVIHRDIKPGNIFLCGDKLKIGDLGIARIESETSVTYDGQVFGTPAYMAPEQVKGQSIDRRVDIWAVGVVIYQMVTGQQPFTGGSVIEVGSNILNKGPALDLVTDPGLRAVIEKALQKDPEERYSTAAEMAIAMQNPAPVLSAPVAVVVPPTPLAVAPKRSKRRYVPALALSLVLTLGIVLAGVRIARSINPEQPRTSATTVSQTKGEDDVMAEAWEHNSLHELAQSSSFRFLPEGGKLDRLDTWCRTTIGADYLAMSPSERSAFVSKLLDRFRDRIAGPVAEVHVSQSSGDGSPVPPIIHQPSPSPFPGTNPPSQAATSPRAAQAASSLPGDLGADLFDVGSSEALVLRLQGQPDGIRYTPQMHVLTYGSSTVTIRNGQVTDYTNFGSLRSRRGPVASRAPEPSANTAVTPPPRPSPAPVAQVQQEEGLLVPQQYVPDLSDAIVMKKLHFRATRVVLRGTVRQYSGPAGVLTIP